MKCPSCNNEPMSFVQFYLLSNPFSTKCDKCGVKLKPDSIIRRMIYIEMIIAVFIAGIVHSFIGMLTARGFAIYIVTIAIVLYPIEKYLWNNGSYKIRE